MVDEYIAPPVLVDNAGSVLYVKEDGANMVLITDDGINQESLTIGTVLDVSPSALPTITWFGNDAISLVGSNNTSYIIYLKTGSVVRLHNVGADVTPINTAKRLVTRRDGSVTMFCRTNDNNLAMVAFHPAEGAFRMQQIVCNIGDIANTQMPAIIQKKNGDIKVIYQNTVYTIK